MFDFMPWLRSGWLTGYIAFSRRPWGKPDDAFDAECHGFAKSGILAVELPVTYGPVVFGPADPMSGEHIAAHFQTAFPELAKRSFCIVGTDTATMKRYSISEGTLWDSLNRTAKAITKRLTTGP